MKITDTQEDALRRYVRDAIAIDPLISLRKLQVVIEKKCGRTLSQAYLIKLIRKSRGDARVLADKEKVEARIQQIRETYRILREGLFNIAYPPEGLAAAKDRIRAMEAIAKLEYNQARIEMDLGLFTRHIGEVAINHRMKPVSGDTMENIVKAFKAWGNVPEPRKIEPKRIVEVKSVEKTNEPIKQPTVSVSPASGPVPIPTVSDNGLITTE